MPTAPISPPVPFQGVLFSAYFQATQDGPEADYVLESVRNLVNVASYTLEPSGQFLCDLASPIPYRLWVLGKFLCTKCEPTQYTVIKGDLHVSRVRVDVAGAPLPDLPTDIFFGFGSIANLGF